MRQQSKLEQMKADRFNEQLADQFNQQQSGRVEARPQAGDSNGGQLPTSGQSSGTNGQSQGQSALNQAGGRQIGGQAGQNMIDSSIAVPKEGPLPNPYQNIDSFINHQQTTLFRRAAVDCAIGCITSTGVGTGVGIFYSGCLLTPWNALAPALIYSHNGTGTSAEQQPYTQVLIECVMPWVAIPGGPTSSVCSTFQRWDNPPKISKFCNQGCLLSPWNDLAPVLIYSHNGTGTSVEQPPYTKVVIECVMPWAAIPGGPTSSVCSTFQKWNNPPKISNFCKQSCQMTIQGNGTTLYEKADSNMYTLPGDVSTTDDSCNMSANFYTIDGGYTWLSSPVVSKCIGPDWDKPKIDCYPACGNDILGNVTLSYEDAVFDLTPVGGFSSTDDCDLTIDFLTTDSGNSFSKSQISAQCTGTSWSITSVDCVSGCSLLPWNALAPNLTYTHDGYFPGENNQPATVTVNVTCHPPWYPIADGKTFSVCTGDSIWEPLVDLELYCFLGKCRMETLTTQHGGGDFFGTSLREMYSGLATSPENCLERFVYDYWQYDGIPPNACTLLFVVQVLSE